MQFVQKAYTLCAMLLRHIHYNFQTKCVPTSHKGDVSMKLQTTIAAAFLLLGSAAAHAADPNLGRNLAATCANCHGTNGNAIKGSGMDALAGMEKSKTLQKLADFKSGDKPASIMHQISKGYTDEQLDLIATYFAAQK
jgi:cytochrome subunit of sulfide dehydrogenase